MARAISRIAVLFIGALLSCSAAHALDPTRRVGEYTIQAWSVEEGLPHSLVHRVVQSPDGYLWIGTWEGLARFNGREFRTFDPPGLALLREDGIRGLAVESDGALVVGAAHGGVLRLRGNDWSRVADAELAGVHVTTLLAARDGTLWVGSEEAGVIRVASDGGVQRIGVEQGLSAGAVYALIEDATGVVLAGTEAGLDRIDGARANAYGAPRGLPGGVVRALRRGVDGSLWVGGAAGLYHAVGERLEAVELGVAANVQALLEDRDHALWIGTLGHGLLRLHAGTVESIGPELGLRGTGLRCLEEDREGLIWVGTTTGLHRIADGPVSALDVARGLSDGYVRSVLQDAQGTMWIGTGSGLDRWRDGRVERLGVAASVPKSAVLSLAAEPSGTLWIGTYDKGLLALGGQAPRPLERKVIGSDEIRALWPARDGALWIGTADGLVERRGAELRRYTTADGLPRNFVRVVRETPDGALWVGTSAGIARRGSDGAFRAFGPGDGLPPRFNAFDVLGDDDGTVWIASDAGLIRHRDGRFRVLGREQGLPNNTLYRVLDDGQGYLWLGSNRGVFRIARRQFEELERNTRTRLAPDVLTKEDGMPASQCNGGSWPAGWRANDGRLWFPTAGGIAVIDPSAMERYPRGSVPIVFERLIVDGAQRDIAAGIQLGPRTQRLRIEFAGLSFRAQHSVRYRFKLDGFDEDWIDAGAAQHAEYTNVPPGAYRFRVQGMLLPADWTHADPEHEAVLGVRLQPPFWRTTWFLALAALAAVALLGGTHRARVARLKRRERELRRLVDERTRDLADKNQALERANVERDDLVGQLAYQATHDSLTGLYNRRAGDERLAAAFLLAEREQRPLTIALLDVDRFKQINDERSHQAGDEALRFVADRLRASLRASDMPARYGGEEFLLVFPDCKLEDAIARCEAIRADIAAREIEIAGQAPLRCTVSIGLAPLLDHAGPTRLLSIADARLYAAKQQGRNRVVACD